MLNLHRAALPKTLNLAPETFILLQALKNPRLSSGFFVLIS
ncbi:hypothetical protein PTET_a0254 [Pseudoalteromonas tetraodonis]|nr:hypothetical protein PTET_a0254 [Pseudoalteromonas tetraodonis]